MLQHNVCEVADTTEAMRVTVFMCMHLFGGAVDMHMHFYAMSI